MDNQILEMLAKLDGNIEKGFAEVNGRIDDVNARIDNVNGRIDDVNARIDNVNSQIDNVNLRIDETNKLMNTRFDAIDIKLTGAGKQFEELSKNTIQLRDDMIKELKYVTRKIHELDREVFIRTDSLQ